MAIRMSPVDIPFDDALADVTDRTLHETAASLGAL